MNMIKPAGFFALIIPYIKSRNHDLKIAVNESPQRKHQGIISKGLPTY